MFLHYLGHAGWLFEEGGTTLLCDPWMSPYGAFYASWFPFPENGHVRLPPVVDGIYLSHAHEDHFDPETLSHFPRDSKILIADFQDPVLRESLAALGFTNVLSVGDGDTVTVGSLSLQIFRDEDSGMYHDSALVVRSQTAAVLNLNDCRLSETYSDRIGHVDVLLGQSSGANWYPLVYEYPEDHAKALAAAKRRRGLERLADAAARVRAGSTIPCAGPACFLDPALSHYNDMNNAADSPFPMMDTAVEFLRRRGHHAFLAMPGDVIDAHAGALRLRARSLHPEEVYGRRGEYLRGYADRKLPDIARRLRRLKPDPSASARFRRELDRVVSTSVVFVPQIRGVVRFQLLGAPDGDVVMDCREGQQAEVRSYRGETVNYRFALDHRLMSDILKQRFINFENILFSMRFSVFREPDVFNDALFAVLVNFDDERLRRAEREAGAAAHGPADVFEIAHEGTRLQVQRRCPHMGADLSVVGQVRGGTITCTRHGWEFRLADGECLNVTAPPIVVRKVPAADCQGQCP